MSQLPDTRIVEGEIVDEIGVKDLMARLGGLSGDTSIVVIQRETAIILRPSADILPLEIEPVYTDTFGDRVAESFRDGSAILGIGLATVIGLGVAFVVKFALALMAAYTMVTGAVATNASAIVGTLVAAVIILLGIRRSPGSNFVTVKGCAKSGFPGPVTIRR